MDDDQDRPGNQPGHQQLGAERRSGVAGHQRQGGDDQDRNEQDDRLPGPAGQARALEDPVKVDEMATNSSPAGAAEAPASARNNSVQPAVE